MRAVTMAWMFGGLVLIAGCGSGGGGGDGQPSAGVPDRAALEGHTFYTDSTTGKKVVPGRRIQLAFDHGSVSLHAGCNRMFGPYSVANGRLLVKGPASTEMACDPALMDQDRWLAGMISSKPEISLDGSELTLAGGEPEVILTLREK